MDMKFSELIEARRSVRRYAKPTQWMPAEGECDLATASVSVAVCADQTWEQFAALADGKREPEGVKSSHKTTLSK